MNVQQFQKDKRNIIDWISELQDYSLIEKIKTIMNKSQENALTSEQKDAINEALADVEKNDTKSHETVMKATKARYPHLF